MAKLNIHDMENIKEIRVLQDGIMTAIHGERLLLSTDHEVGERKVYDIPGPIEKDVKFDRYNNPIGGNLIAVIAKSATVFMSTEITMTEEKFGKPPYIKTRG